jgi:hypothetical protein
MSDQCPTCKQTILLEEHQALAERSFQLSVEKMSQGSMMMNYHQLTQPIVVSPDKDPRLHMVTHNAAGETAVKPLLLVVHGTVHTYHPSENWFMFVPLADSEAGYVLDGLSTHETLEQITDRLFEPDLTRPCQARYFWKNSYLHYSHDEPEPIEWMVRFDSTRCQFFTVNALPVTLPSLCLQRDQLITLGFEITEAGYQAVWCRAMDASKKDDLIKALKKYRYGESV